MDDAFNRLTAGEAARRIARGTLTSEALIRSCLDRIDEREPAIGAWTHIDPEAALAEARARDAAAPRGPLHGVPVGVKDIIDTSDMPTELGSPIHADRRPATDAACIAAIRRAGGIVLGKTVTTEFATFTPGRTVNPHDPERTPGGSSSGTAAAVADHMVPAGFGTQTSGSVIRPASFCGVCGFKPSFGAVSRDGVLVIVPSFDCVGYMARGFDDLALIHGVVAGGDTTALADGPGRRPRIAVCRGPKWNDAEPATVEAMAQAAQRLSDLGADVDTLDLPAPFDGLEAAHATIMDVGLARSLCREYEDHRDLISDRLRARMERGMALETQTFLDALTLAARCRADIDALIGERDALLTPSARGEAPVGLAMTGHPTFNMMWTLLHLPCATVPGLTGPAGLPVGIQLVGRYGTDRALLALAGWLHGRLTG